ncbi:TonB-dependent receptor [Sphingomonas sp. AP4-R1]|uniref:TonB-dependent receptor n=1 Tax=Sphingomonas sp. AP4-R1 TaxID=2735134 RepID=UPI0014935B5A|nr:TonB-dependent receptor [Sphingomonas sp. AP4-R1]QJU58033.1 TonB-dependent receptor [Sphingomonas sp. AP4-R1]
MTISDRRRSSASRQTQGFLALSCVGSIGLAAPLLAQAAPPATPEKGTELEGVTVTDTAITEGSYKTESASNPKYTAPLINTPRTVTVIPAQVIHDTASATLQEALRTVPGITMGAGEGGNPLGDRPFIRGFDSQASTYLDGVRDIGAQTREVFAVEQIEVVKGADSVVGGRGSAGGSLNLVSKMPTATRSASASLTGGNANYKRITVDVNQPLNDFVGVRIAGMWHDQDVAGRDAIWQKRWGVEPSVKLGLNGPTSATLSFYHLETNELPDSGIPYLFTAANVPNGITETSPARNFTTIGGRQVSVPQGAFYGLKDRDFRKTNVNNATLRFEHDFGNNIKIRNTSRYGRSTQGYVWTQPDDQQGNVYGTNAASPATAGGYVWRRTNTRWSEAEGLINQSDVYGTFETAGIKHSFTASAEISYEKAQNGTYVADAGTGAVIASGSTSTPRCTPAMIARYNCTTIDTPNPSDPWVSYATDTTTGLASIQRSLPQTWTITDTSTKAASFFDTVTFTDWLLLNIGGRYDHYKTSVSPGIAVTAAPSTARTTFGREDDLWTYQAGLIVKPTPDTSVYVSTSSSATPPGSFLAQGQDGNAIATTTQAATDALKVEKTKSYEVGAKANLFDGNLSLTGALFKTDTSNARTTVENGLVAYIGKRKIKGVEIGFNGNITPEWNIFGGYTYMDSKIADGGITTTTNTTTGAVAFAPSVNTGKQFPNTPKHSFTTFTNYKITPKFTLGGGAIYMAKVYGGYSDTRVLSNTGVLSITKPLARMVQAYWRFDANASYQLTDRIGLQLNVNNLTDKRYYDKAYAAHYANQAAGRTVLGTVNLRY